MKTIVTRDVPYMFAISVDELRSGEIFELERILNVEPNNFVLVKRWKDCIVLNKNLENLNEIEEIIKKIMTSKYFPKKLLDMFQSLTDEKSTEILIRYYSDWRDLIRERELHNQALKMLKSAKGLRISWKVKKTRNL